MIIEARAPLSSARRPFGAGLSWKKTPFRTFPRNQAGEGNMNGFPGDRPEADATTLTSYAHSREGRGRGLGRLDSAARRADGRRDGAR